MAPGALSTYGQIAIAVLWRVFQVVRMLQDEEAYVCIYSHRYADTILFHHEGGVDIGDVDAKALKLDVPVGESITVEDIKSKLLMNVSAAKKR